MKLRDYAVKIVKLARKHPEFEVVYARDEEGNGFGIVTFEPSLGHYDRAEREFDSEVNASKRNAVCIN